MIEYMDTYAGDAKGSDYNFLLTKTKSKMSN